MSNTAPEPTSPYAQLRDLVDVAETYAEDGAPLSAQERLLEARTVLDGILRPRGTRTAPSVPLENLVATVEAAALRRAPEDIAAVPWVATAIGEHDERIGALGELVEQVAAQHRAAIVEWIGRDWTCLCVTYCAEDPATACSLSGQVQHVHPAIPGRPGVYGPCPVHPDAPGDR
ncbi:hypothetical protein [Streptomyces rubiginosohelvolus]|uniref:hypothetical protein n=1 Tax=Streptomyces rubiginosohelvolus TaxID=67362 RepID=UPI0035DA22A1